MDDLVDAVQKTIINDIIYDLNTATASEILVDFLSDPDTVTHTRKRIMDQKLLSFRTIREVSVLPTPAKPRIPAIKLAPQTLLTLVMQEIFADAASGNTWINRTPR